MKKTNIKKMLSFIVCMLLIAAIALFTIGCNDNNTPTTSSEPADKILAETDVTELGDGQTQVSFTVVDVNGKESHFIIHTDKTILSEALIEHNLIAGEDSQYGLYVKTVNGTTLDYDKDGKYWAFYIDDKYANSGVENTEISETQKYYFKAE